MAAPDAEEQVADLMGVLDIARRLGATLDLRTMLSHIEQAARKVMECERASVFLYDRSSDELYSFVATGVEEIRFGAGQGLAGAAVKTRELVNVSDAYAEPRFNREVDKQTGFRTRNVLTVPLLGLDEAVVGCLQVLNKVNGNFSEWDEQLALTLAAQAGAAVQRQMLLDEYALKRKLEHDLGIARTIQQQLLPSRPPQVAGFDVAGWNKPADETGGDAFDFMPLRDGRLAITVADATGHGIGPALVIAECRALLRAMALSCSEPGEIVARVNDLLVEDLPADRFVTCFFGLLDPGQETLRYCSGGHGPLLHFRKSTGDVAVLGATGLPLGVLAGMTCEPVQPIVFRPGDMLVLVTDGFHEWVNAASEQYGVDRLIEVIRRHQDDSARAIIDALYRDVIRFGEGTSQADDLTAVLIKKA